VWLRKKGGNSRAREKPQNICCRRYEGARGKRGNGNGTALACPGGVRMRDVRRDALLEIGNLKLEIENEMGVGCGQGHIK
jgi:hypothetical protein